MFLVLFSVAINLTIHVTGHPRRQHLQITIDISGGISGFGSHVGAQAPVAVGWRLDDKEQDIKMKSAGFLKLRYEIWIVKLYELYM